MPSRFTEVVLARPWRVVLGMLVCVLLFGNGLRFLRADTDVTNDLPQNIPAKRLYDEIEKIFPAKEMLIVAARGGDLFSVDAIGRMDRLTRHIEKLPQVQSVMSPTSARIISATDGGMEVREAADPLPRTEREAGAFRRRLFSQPKLAGNVVSRDGTTAALLVFVKAGVREADAAEAIIRIAGDPEQNQGFELHVAGRGAAIYWSKMLIGRDMGMLSTVALGVVVLLLGLTFRSFRGVLLPMGVVTCSVVWTLGLMGYLKVPITHSTEIMPILLIAIGVADGIHIMKGYHAHARSEGDRREVVRLTMADLNRPVILTSITTAAGFLALGTSGIRSIAILGAFTAFGVMAAMTFSMAFLPAVLSLLPLPAKKGSRDPSDRFFQFERLEGWARRYALVLVEKKRVVTTFILLVVVLAAYGATRVPVEFSNSSNFPRAHPLRKAIEVVNENFGGANSLVVVVEGERPDAIKDPGVLRKMDALQAHMETLPHVGNVQSISDFIKQMHRVMHGDQPEQYRLPGEQEQEKGIEVVEVDGREEERDVTFTVPGRELVAQYLALYDMSSKPGDFANLVTYDYSTARISVLVDTDAAGDLTELSESVRGFIREHFGTLRAELTGMSELIRAVNNLVVTGQGWSIGSSLVFVFLVTAGMFRSLTLGLFATTPLFFSLFLNFGLMGIAGIELNVMTMATSSVAVGVGIDYAIHFVHRYRVERRSGATYEEAVPRTMESSGVAILLNALTVAAGFLALAFSQFTGVRHMGILIAVTMLTSAFAALTLLPVLFVWLKPRAFRS